MRRRFEQACEMLTKPHLSIADIAHQCGFASSQDLAAVMRSQLATTPTAYRRALLT
jgi:AraC family transcriptional regulator